MTLYLSVFGPDKVLPVAFQRLFDLRSSVRELGGRAQITFPKCNRSVLASATQSIVSSLQRKTSATETTIDIIAGDL